MVIALYVLALYLPNTSSVIALLLGIVAFLLSLYFDPDLRFFRIGTVALFIFGIQTAIPSFNLELNPESILFKLSSSKKLSNGYEYLLIIVAIIGFVLSFLREKQNIVIREGVAKGSAILLLMVVIALSVRDVSFSNNIINMGGKTQVNNTGNKAPVKGDLNTKPDSTVIVTTEDVNTSLDDKIIKNKGQPIADKQKPTACHSHKLLKYNRQTVT